MEDLEERGEPVEQDIVSAEVSQLVQEHMAQFGLVEPLDQARRQQQLWSQQTEQGRAVHGVGFHEHRCAACADDSTRFLEELGSAAIGHHRVASDAS
jgi:hypothetical protein